MEEGTHGPPVCPMEAGAVVQQNAVVVRGGCKTIGNASSGTLVLNRLDMTVPRGCIYGLLGASGCGKTTLLSCIVGRRALDRGSVWVLGGRPGSEESGIPGNRLGYMPQELALTEFFTIRETFLYFSWLYGMSARELDEKMAILDEVLKLPPHSTQIRFLSTGQQRRVSLGAALLHDPELIVLDEPTVGVDPLLRQGIWDYLLQLTSKANRTIIVTTHYIEEARQADYVGLMRGGCLVAESSPDHLLRTHAADTLETVFLELCKRQESSRPSSIRSSKGQRGANGVLAVEGSKGGQISGDGRTKMSEDSDHELSEIPRHKNLSEEDCREPPTIGRRKKSFSTLYGEWKAMHYKNWIRFIRNPGVCGFIFGFPIFQIVLYFMAIGGDPSDLHIAVVNQERVLDGQFHLRPVDCSDYSSEGHCNDTAVSCRYLQSLQTSRFMTATLYSDRSAAIDAVRRGKAWGAIVIPENFTKALTARLEEGVDADAVLLNSGDVLVHLDMTSQQLSTLVQRRLLVDLQHVLVGMAADCGLSPKIVSAPLQFHEPVFGDREPTFQSFTTPAVIITTIFFLALGLTVTLIITEKTEGIWDRTMVMGITPLQILQTHLEWQVLLICGQIFEVAILTLFVYNVEMRGSIFLLLIHMFLQGLSGMAFGFVISSCSGSISEANYMATGSFLPMVVMSGAMWPLEGMPKVFRYLAYAMPSTMATESLRSIMFRGWGISMSTVYLGFVSTIAWIIFFLLSCVLLIKYRKT
ncbi:ABC transporter G family member 20-like [Ischnura elegans]|uniref:ABC transporter G family member 20-like n=1 Tax=Ischnura elegans TaxID=197161 RepID=UPI001ED8964C|nr:ABC transporter G family member 20-like [Ischnura elegans]